jgi:hypothetical protein
LGFGISKIEIYIIRAFVAFFFRTQIEEMYKICVVKSINPVLGPEVL